MYIYVLKDKCFSILEFNQNHKIYQIDQSSSYLPLFVTYEPNQYLHIRNNCVFELKKDMYNRCDQINLFI
jgi:hypothetical protein